MKGRPLTQEHPIFSEISADTDPHNATYWNAPHIHLYSVKDQGWKYIHGRRAPGQDMLFELSPESVYEGDNVIELENEKAEALWAVLQDRFSIPTEFLFMPVVRRP